MYSYIKQRVYYIIHNHNKVYELYKTIKWTECSWNYVDNVTIRILTNKR